VADVVALLSRPVGFKLRGHDADLFLMGVPEGTVGWPAAVRDDLAKRPRLGGGVIHRGFAKNFPGSGGDRVPIGPRRLRGSAIVGGGNAFAYQFAWANQSDVNRIAGAEGFTSYFLVRTDPGRAAAEVGRAIVREVAGTQVFPGTELADRNADNLRHGFLPILW